MIENIDSIIFSYSSYPVAKIILALLLGIFVGLEREWSDKPAGVRTISLISIIGCSFAIIDNNYLIFIGGFFVITLSFLLGIKGLISDEFDGLSLTTSSSIMIIYSGGILIGYEYYSVAFTLVILSSALLTFKNKLHRFAGNLTKEEIKDSVKFLILSVVLYFFLPDITLGPYDSIQPKLVWVLLVAISILGFINYVLVKKYSTKGLKYSSFFGGLVNSTAVVTEIASREEFRKNNKLSSSNIILANSAMTIRNSIILILFIPSTYIFSSLILGTLAVVSIVISYYLSEKTDENDLEISELSSPFNLNSVLKFGILFIIVLIVSNLFSIFIGNAGFLFASFSSGLVSSGTTTTTAVSLFESGSISGIIATISVLVGNISSIVVKTVYVYQENKKLSKEILKWSIVSVIPSILISILLVLF